jgi:hypothetical protein
MMLRTSILAFEQIVTKKRQEYLGCTVSKGTRKSQ